MKRRELMLLNASIVMALLVVANANAGTIKIGRFSDQASPRRAVIGARVDVADAHAARHASPSEHASTQARPARAGEATASLAASSGTSAPLPNPFPPLASTASILKAAHPAGPGSFWYGDGSGHVCMYAPGSVLPCFTVVTAAGAPAAAAVNPAGIAASVARRLPLVPGQIEASPTRSGLTGAASWFWLDPAPQRRELTVTLAGEAVQVVAEPSVQWRFGDGAILDGGAGVPYQAGAVPPGAVTHDYQTRCLPGDQGHDPYVLAGCGQDGYSVEALVVWKISYSAAGPIATSGTLPTRTTSSTVIYPVGEARAFLISGSS